MQNADIRQVAKKARVTLWMIAERLEISEPSMTRLLRHELDDETKEKIMKIIEELRAA